MWESAPMLMIALSSVPATAGLGSYHGRCRRLVCPRTARTSSLPREWAGDPCCLHGRLPSLGGWKIGTASTRAKLQAKERRKRTFNKQSHSCSIDELDAVKNLQYMHILRAPPPPPPPSLSHTCTMTITTTTPTTTSQLTQKKKIMRCAQTKIEGKLPYFLRPAAMAKETQCVIQEKKKILSVAHVSVGCPPKMKIRFFAWLDTIGRGRGIWHTPSSYSRHRGAQSESSQRRSSTTGCSGTDQLQTRVVTEYTQGGAPLSPCAMQYSTWLHARWQQSLQNEMQTWALVQELPTKKSHKEGHKKRQWGHSHLHNIMWQ